MFHHFFAGLSCGSTVVLFKFREIISQLWILSFVIHSHPFRNLSSHCCVCAREVTWYHLHVTSLISQFRTSLRPDATTRSPKLKMEKEVRASIVFLACLMFSAAGIIQADDVKESRVRHLFVQRQSPLPGAPRKLLKVEHEPLEKSSGDEDAHKVFSRVRRSLNPDRTPKVNTVSTDVVVWAVKFVQNCVQPSWSSIKIMHELVGRQYFAWCHGLSLDFRIEIASEWRCFRGIFLFESTLPLLHLLFRTIFNSPERIELNSLNTSTLTHVQAKRRSDLFVYIVYQ